MSGGAGFDLEKAGPGAVECWVRQGKAGGGIVLEKVVKMSPAALQCLLAGPGSLKVDILRPGFLMNLT